jgi:predicted NAD-dependent protein-ADP-ribosyltransferase YbiA (DUF1768 family)
MIRRPGIKESKKSFCGIAMFIRALLAGFVSFNLGLACGQVLAADPAPDKTAATAVQGKPEELRDGKYPARWWAPEPKEGAPSWEILPQEAGPGEVILSKRHADLGLLSNFAATPFEYHGKKYASVEGFWQMMKFPEGPDDPRAKFAGLKWDHTRDEVAQMTAFDAKRAGDQGSENMKKMGINWVSFAGQQIEYKPAQPGEHYKIIVEAMKAKVQQNPNVKAALLSTGDLVLKPDHHQEPGAVAAWNYNEILMQIRAELQQQKNSAK